MPWTAWGPTWGNSIGVRSVVGPLLGWLVQTKVSFHAALVVSAALEAAAAVWMFLLARRVHIVT